MSGADGGVRIDRAAPVARVVLARPAVRNAFDDELIRENGLYAALHRKQLLEEELAAS